MRAGWLLAISLTACATLALMLSLGLNAAFAALFRAWNVDANTAWRAPGWARFIFAWHQNFATLAVRAALLGLCLPLRRLWRSDAQRPRFSPRTLGIAASAGVGMALLLAIISLVPDSSRLQWPLSAPRFVPALPALCAVSLVGVLAEEAITKRVLFDGLIRHWGRPWAMAVVCAVFFVIAGGYSGNVPCAVNVALLGVLSCLIYERAGLWACVGFRWAWSVSNAFLLGFGGGDAAVYRLFGVSEKLLTGGDAGPVYGLYLTLMLAALIAWMLLHCNNDKTRP